MKIRAELQRAVLDELNCDPSVMPALIAVMDKDGIVTLSGSVATFAEKRTAERAAKRVAGVTVTMIAATIAISPRDQPT